MRTETDFLGSRELDDGALYGIHALRARENFPITTRFSSTWYRAVGTVKLACYLTYQAFKQAVTERQATAALPFPLIDDDIVSALIAAATEVSEGKHLEHFIVPALAGGAGTSINMNINEIIANVALLKLGKRPGQYESVDPIEHANVFQSTNDVIPTSLRVALMRSLLDLEEGVNRLRAETERLEREHATSVRIAYTQMQAAVPSSYGKLFGAYSEALSRDWWRISKSLERLKSVNLGGSAVGTGIAVPRFFIMEATRTLARITGLPLARSENLSDATSNVDPLVEVHAIVKAHAVNLEKMVSDLRLLASDLVGRGEVTIPKLQVGSSIMPAKVNPVIPEFVVSCTHRVLANDTLIASLAAAGCLDLNAYIPAIGHALIESLQLLSACDVAIREHLLIPIEIHPSHAASGLYRSQSVTTALIPIIGYHGAEKLARVMGEKGLTIFEANAQLNLVDPAELERILAPSALLRLGYSLDEIKPS